MEMVISCVFFVFESRQIQNKHDPASSSRTGEYWPLVIFVQTLLRSVRIAATLGQYSPVLPSHSASKRLIFLRKVLAKFSIPKIQHRKIQPPKIVLEYRRSRKDILKKKMCLAIINNINQINPGV